MHDTQPPTVIYLPSSGGNAGSRITPELVTRRRFPFRRYSFQDDGSMIVRVRHPSRDTRPRPYPKTVVRFDVPPSRHGSPLSESGSTSIHPTPTSDPNHTVELLKNLVPALIDDPTSFEDSIPSICAAHDIDRSSISAIMQAAKRRHPSHPIERTRTLDRTSTVPSSLTSASTATATSLVPYRRERPFSSGPRGSTVWYSTQSDSTISNPPHGIQVVAGDLYIHKCLSTSARQIWLVNREAQWISVPDDKKVVHPAIADRVLSLRSDGSPNWITITGFTNAQGRKRKVMDFLP